MAFQTNVFRGGEWVTQTIDLQTVLKASSATKPPRQRPPKHPKCGLITTTVVESSVAHHILPCRLRSLQHADVAFVGDHFVQIRELRKDGQLQDIIHKSDFGDRIRNAKVIGSLPDSILTGEDAPSSSSAKAEDDGDIDMLRDVPAGTNSSTHSLELAPQMLLVVLERGDCVFMVLRTKQDGTLEFVTSQFELPNIRTKYPGFHLAVDPSSRYVAVGCSEKLFMVYELESRETLGERYRRHEPLEPVRKCRPRVVHGLIHKMDFLFPRPEDDYHIILLLIVVRDGRSRMVVYEWEAGDDLLGVFRDEKAGHRLPVEHQMPLLLIPLMVRTAFFAVYPDRIAVGKDVLIGPPSFDTFHITSIEPSRFYYGRNKPVWATWTRPFRLTQFAKDWLYLAREDGVVIVLDIDSESILNASQVVKSFDCNISTAFCALFDQFADILIMGSDSGPGAIWQVLARQESVKLGVIPNWAPTVDFVTTNESSRSQAASTRGNRIPSEGRQARGMFRSPDRIFAAGGRGVTGTVTEYRHGLQANIGLYLDCEPTTTHAWLFPIDGSSTGEGYYMLTSMPDRSTIWQLSEDFSAASEPTIDEVPFDLSSRTVAAAGALEGVILQVTENYIVCVSRRASVRVLHQDLIQGDQVTVAHADILDGHVVLSTGSYGNSFIHLLQVDPDLSLAAVRSFAVEGEVTCVSFATLNGVRHVFVGLWKDNSPTLARLALDGLDAGRFETVPLDLLSLSDQPEPDRNSHDITNSRFEGYTSIAPMEIGHQAVLVLGTRNGEVLTVFMDEAELKPTIKAEKFGLTPATARATIFRGQEAVMVCCGSALYLFTGFDAAKTRSFREKLRVWPVHAQDASQPTPPIHSAIALESHFTENKDHLPILVAAGPQILMAEVLPRPQQVPWSIPLHGTPLKILYSHHLECLVVAVKLNDKATLKFFDPDTGEDLSYPTGKHGGEVEAVQGLDKVGDEILGLSEWIYQRDGHTWSFVLVSTRDGELLVISAERLPPDESGATARIRYWTRYRKKGITEPIYSVIGHSDGLIYCAGSTVRWEMLDIVEKKLKAGKSCDLRSPVTTMRVVKDKIIALTSQDSICVMNPAGDSTQGEMTLEHADPKSRPAMHMIEVSGDREDSGASILLLCDRANGVAGLWVPWQQPGRNCEVLFEADLPASVIKFRRGRTRQPWLHAERTPRYGVLPSTVDGAEIIGLCADGSLQHFTIVNTEVLAVLGLVQNLALASPTICPFTYELDDEDDVEAFVGDGSHDMHIDGDLLRRCLDKRALPKLFANGKHLKKLGELLSELDGGEHTAGIEPESAAERYLDVVYDIMEYYLGPVL